jgi:hypothetical protein
MRLIFIILLSVFILLPVEAKDKKKVMQKKEAAPLAAYKVDGVWYVIGEDGKDLFDPIKNIEIVGFSDGFFRITARIDGKSRWCFMNLKGEIKIVPECDYVMDFHDGMALTVKFLDTTGMNRLHGFVDSTGKEVVPLIYKDATGFSEGWAYVLDKDKRGYIDKKGEFVLGLQNLVGYPFKEGIAAVSNKNFQVGYINKKAEFLIEPKYDEPAEISEGLIRVNKDGYFGFVSPKGDTVIQLHYQDARDFSEGRAFVGLVHNYLMSVWGLIDLKDSMLVNYKFKIVRDFSEGLAAVSEDKLWGFIGSDGKYTLQPTYQTAGSFKNGMAWVSDKEKDLYGFIDKSGKLLIPVPMPENVIDLRFNMQVY